MGEIKLPEGCSPEQRAKMAALTEAVARNPGEARAALELGNALYEAGAREEGIGWWEKAAKMDRENSVVWRNWGIGYYNVFRDKDAAKGAYQRALRLALESRASGGDAEDAAARVLYECDQLWKRVKERPEDRLAKFEKYQDLVMQRDDLAVENCALLNQAEQYEKALETLRGRRFVPWEHGERLVLGQWARANIGLGRRALWRAPGAGGDPGAALEMFETVLRPPENLGETHGPLEKMSETFYWSGMAAKAAGKTRAGQWYLKATAESWEDSGGGVRTYAAGWYWAGMAMRELERHEEARRLFERLLEYSEWLIKTPANVGGAATSLSGAVFDEDLQARQIERAMLLEALARHGLNGEDGADRKRARRLLNDILRDNPSHQVAADLLVGLDWMP